MLPRTHEFIRRFAPAREQLVTRENFAAARVTDGTEVLYISYNGALEEIVPSQVIPYLKGLAKAGYKFTLLTFEKKQDMRKKGRKGLRRLKREFMAMGIDWHCLCYHKKPSFLATSFDVLLGTVYASYLVISRKIRIIHARSVIPATMSLVPRLFGAKFIFDTRGLLAEEYVGGGHWKEGCIKYRVTNFFEKLCLRLADVIVVLTRRHYEYILSLPWFENRNKTIPIEVIPCCVDLERFRYNPCEVDLLKKNESLQDSFVFTYLGKVGKHYMLKEMLDFFNSASERLPNSKFMFVSQNNPEDILDIIAGHGVDSKKVIIKRPFYEEIPSLISLSDAGIFFINPYKKFASSPIKLGEFLSCGIPVIINSGIGDTEELVDTNKVGVAIEGFNRSDYERALSEFLKLVKEGDALYHRCRKTAERYLSLDSGVEKYHSLYSRLF